ncbi:sodium channel subunit beta-3 [Sphaerodactylus townsendi]|uniref:Sodium channel subunit beta-3 n=1 Tax=Sphaerodactylus townsendi TaxID=933632 RepID=A0ACB8EXM8_9SAUR|nr:sodium channel subunit beta-3 [Sphaerodactylus townsendi]XP_048369484.1 sodium channel subunit beta-3 [Sphaerodactylus townsendi]XP_048369485.1 sodium channel subunit beta-3 [Sphaerodactylus townsendi]
MPLGWGRGQRRWKHLGGGGGRELSKEGGALHGAESRSRGTPGRRSEGGSPDKGNRIAAFPRRRLPPRSCRPVDPGVSATRRPASPCSLGVMAALTQVASASSLLVVLWAGICSAVCVKVPSETEAVQGTHMKLLCISCMKREEVSANTVVEWFYRADGDVADKPIYVYENEKQPILLPQTQFSGRLMWNGSKDMQDVSISVRNISLNDSGVYTCKVNRTLNFDIYQHTVTTSTLIHLTVVEKAGEDFTSVISEIMMYILLVFLTLWLLIEMVYCYRKVSKAEEAAQENATDYLAIPSENKENCAVPVEE